MNDQHRIRVGYAGVIRETDAIRGGQLDAMAIFNVMKPMKKGDIVIPAKLECTSSGSAFSLAEGIVQKI
jgi:hypothetical protein